MITMVVQRWRDRRESYRPAGEPIRTADYEVAELKGEGSDTLAKAFVERHHYSGVYVAARRRFGLFRHGELVGVAVFSMSVNEKALKPFDKENGLELGRFVLLDVVPANGESWTLARCFELLRREGWAGVLSCADPVPRTDATGRRVFPGHIGNVYQALNGVFAGRTTPRTLRVLPDGTVVNARSKQKTRALEPGAITAVRQLLDAGAEPFDSADHRGWLRRALAQVTRRLRHPGCYRYLWALDRHARKLLPSPLPYPKFSVRPR